ncbi:hypothetical protein BO70DRAFT_351933 [Aspergillus heteromorphus CBS 117.55]|uniref:Uncharacterized protein n=1 Tax=Aspergillus heteromorphus CBS 117.55 TaxID=1448321 RepID=A0A317WIA3_9EURO|nr:uncharacterized protein BO70DRAFT_351933 [Aspergillus heteromorphus CBS 117.55]PWY84788.1 hypothetical protein BO70DRAFT_351933 [Aspergillus heteromorphus CBS 117.55]
MRLKVHVPGTDIKGSIWALDYSNDRQLRMATFQSGNGNGNGDHQLLSFGAASNKTYTLSYSMNIGQYGSITARRYRDDQLTFNVFVGLEASYEGFATFDVIMFGIQATRGRVDRDCLQVADKQKREVRQMVASTNIHDMR